MAHGVWVVLSAAAGSSGKYRETTGGSGISAPDGRLVAQAGPEPDAVVTTILS
jgi:predicted amidohydrolase